MSGRVWALPIFPTTLSHQEDGEFGPDDGPKDGSGYLLGAGNTQTNMSIVIP